MLLHSPYLSATLSLRRGQGEAKLRNKLNQPTILNNNIKTALSTATMPVARSYARRYILMVY
jgi:hypothetical protein